MGKKKNKSPSDFDFGNLARLLSSPGKGFLQQTHLGSLTPIPDGSCQILSWRAAGKKDDWLFFNWKVGEQGGEQIIS